ncbi:hypothetical protein [Saccharospirillum sp. MSK14-1]|uniref:hypothetical protein n=1 Tax=Saccharospirillum sp. MSK14-1 TaxID=1897632 RepID=UPI001304D837|nr:hypothetical protein [Saccharospirillum sp. MSK14-1]
MSIKQLWLAVSMLGMVTLLSRPQALSNLTESLLEAGLVTLVSVYETLLELKVGR